MSLDEAIERCLALQDAADEGWGLGFDRATVEAAIAPALAILEAAATSPERARKLVAQLRKPVRRLG